MQDGNPAQQSDPDEEAHSVVGIEPETLRLESANQTSQEIGAKQYSEIGDIVPWFVIQELIQPVMIEVRSELSVYLSIPDVTAAALVPAEMNVQQTFARSVRIAPGNVAVAVM
jgi:hypothetical protein